ncbi:serine aminopeptidase domain-containing protein [Thermaurantiacus sp.]
MRLSRRALLIGLAGLAAPAAAQRLPPAGLPPLPPEIRVQDLEVEGVAIRLWQPAALSPESRAILFSHGANAEARKYDELTAAWAAEGHVVAAVTHREPAQGAGAIDYAAARAGWRARLADMRVAARHLQSVVPGRELVAAGHSYGALVAQALGGAGVLWDGDGGPLPMPGVVCVLAFSPPGPLPSFIDAAGWSKLAVPLFVQTGTADVVPPVAPTWEAHAASFEAARVSPRWLWVGKDVDHYFGNRIGRPERRSDEAQARLFAAAVAASVAFIEGRAPPPQPAGVTLLVR